MTGAHAPAVRAVVEEHVVRIEIHLVRLAQGHDPMGHLFAIERLARSAIGMVVRSARVRACGAQEMRPPVHGSHPMSPENRSRPRSANVVVLALVVALLDLEQRRDRGKVRPPMARNPAA